MKELERLKNMNGQDDQGNEVQELSADERYLLGMKQDEEDQYLLDKLFIETGEDVEDLFIAFKYFKLMWVNENLLIYPIWSIFTI